MSKVAVVYWSMTGNTGGNGAGAGIEAESPEFSADM